MIEWFDALVLEKQLFYGIGIIASLVLCVQVVLLLLGFGGDAVDVGGADAADAAAAGADHSSGLGVFSLNTITAFFLGFGWAGAIMLGWGWPLPLAVVCAGIAGTCLMFATYGLMLSLTRLQSDGTRKYDSAVGTTAAVYSTIPGGANTEGQIEVLIGGRLTTAMARYRGEENLPPGSRVRIVAMDGPTSYLVEPLSAGKPNPSSTFREPGESSGAPPTS